MMPWLDLREGVAELFLDAQTPAAEDAHARFASRLARDRALANARLAAWRERHRDRLRAERLATYSSEKRRAKYEAQIAKHGRESVRAASRRAHAKVRANRDAHEAQKAQKRAYAKAHYAAKADEINAKARARRAARRLGLGRVHVAAKRAA